MHHYLVQLRKFYYQHKRMPSYAELAKVLGFKSKNAAQYVVKKWLASGLVKKDMSGKLLPSAMLGLRQLGTVQAGFPSAAEEEQGDSISLDEWLIENHESCYLLKVTGDSMVEAGIKSGDTVILNRARQPRLGDIVVAQVDNEWTMKYFDRRGRNVLLVPANKAYQPIIPRQELKIAGVVTAVLRKYY